MKKFLAIGNLALILAIGAEVSPVGARPQPASESGPSDRQNAPPAQHRISDAMLRDFVTDQNKDLPVTFSESMRWDSTALESGRTLIYNFTLLDPAFNANDPRQLEQLKNLTVRTFCDDDWIQGFLDDAVSFHFKYLGSRGDFITDVRVDRQNCR